MIGPFSVTFDSNLIEVVLDENRAREKGVAEIFNAIKNQRITAFVAQAYFAHDAIRRSLRAETLRDGIEIIIPGNPLLQLLGAGLRFDQTAIVNLNEHNSEDEMQAMVVSSLQLLQRKGARHVAMNGIRIDMTGRGRKSERPEELLVRCVTDWCLKHPSAFESVSFVDLRGGFNACDKDGAYESSMLEERSVQTNDCCTKHANAQTAKEGVAASQGQDDDAQFLLRVLLWIVGVVTVGALIAAVVL